VSTFPVLSTPPCPECLGQATFSTGEYTEVVCTACSGTGEGIPVCSACGQTPEVKSGYEVCGCPETICEACERPGILDNANICTSCLQEMAEILRREADDYAILIDPEIKYGMSVGWL